MLLQACHRYFQFGGCGLDQKVVRHLLTVSEESGTVFAGPPGPSMPPWLQEIVAHANYFLFVVFCHNYVPENIENGMFLEI